MRQTVDHGININNRWFARLVGALAIALLAAALPAKADAAAAEPAALLILRDSASLPHLFVPILGAVTQVAPLALSPHAANDGTYWMTTVKVDLTGHTRACFTLEYEGTPAGWTVNIGDDSTVDGFGGGGPGLSSSVAEIQMLEEVMTMFSGALGAGLVDQLAVERLRLLDGAFKICVSDALVTWGNPSGSVSTTNSRLGFQIPDNAPATAFSPAGNGNRDIFVGFNRVVNGTARNGVGLSRVIITLE